MSHSCCQDFSEWRCVEYTVQRVLNEERVPPCVEEAFPLSSSREAATLYVLYLNDETEDRRTEEMLWEAEMDRQSIKEMGFLTEP